MLALAAAVARRLQRQAQQQANNGPKIKVRGPGAEAASPARCVQSRDRPEARDLRRRLYLQADHRRGLSSATWKNLDMWMAHCVYDKRPARDWAVFAGPDGSAQVRDCKDITPDCGLPACKIKKRPNGVNACLYAAPAKRHRSAASSRLCGIALASFFILAGLRRSLTVTQLPCFTSSRQLPSGLVTRLPPWARACRSCRRKFQPFGVCCASAPGRRSRGRPRPQRDGAKHQQFAKPCHLHTTPHRPLAQQQ